MERIYIYGAGGHSKVLIEIAEACDRIVGGIVEDPISKEQLLGYPVKSDFISIDKYWVIGIGNNISRKYVAGTIKGKLFDTLIHPHSFISKRSEIGVGSVVMAGVSINSSTNIGMHCIINTNVSVDHDCIIHNFVHLSPNVALAGNVTVGEGTHIGVGASVIQNIKIGKWCTIGAGAVIIRDVLDGETVVGNPGKTIRKIDINNF